MNKITTFGVLKGFVQGVVGSVIGAVSYPLGTLPLNRHLPLALVKTYQAIWRTNTVGPNLKMVAFITVPIAGAVIPPLLLTASTLFGFVRGAMSGSFLFSYVEREKTGFFSSVFGTLFKDLSKANKTLIEDFLPRLNDYQPEPLLKGERPFDISPFRACTGVLCGIVLTVIEGPALSFLTLVRGPKFLFKLAKEMLSSIDNFAMLILALLLLFVAIGVLILLIPVIALGTICFGIGAGCVRGYSTGIRSAVTGMFLDLSKWNEVLSHL